MKKNSPLTSGTSCGRSRGPPQHLAEREAAAVRGADPLGGGELPHLLQALVIDVEPGDPGKRCALLASLLGCGCAVKRWTRPRTGEAQAGRQAEMLALYRWRAFALRL